MVWEYLSRVRYTTVHLALIVVFGFLLAACSSYPPLSPGGANLPSGVEMTDERQTIVLRGEASASDSAGVIFYPGGLVQPEAYLSILAPIADAGHPVIIVKMPLDLAVTAPNRAAKLLNDMSETDAGRSWVMAGHSLGGAMAARFIVREGDRFPLISGLILLGAYPPGNDSLANLGYPVLSIWASEDGLATVEDRRGTRALLPDDTVTAVIQGGNHAGFGEYGPQDGDGVRTISLAEQHRQVQDLILGFLTSVGPDAVRGE